jgi:hypothetical protein
MIRAYKFRLYKRFFSDKTSNNVPLLFTSIKEAKNIFEYSHSLFISSQAAQSPSNPVDSPAAAKAYISLFATLMSKYLLAL